MKYLIKAVIDGSWGFMNPRTGKKQNIFDGTKRTICAFESNGQFVTGLTEAEAREFETKLNKPNGYFGPRSAFWSSSPTEVMGKDHPGFKFEYTVKLDANGEDQGTIIETGDLDEEEIWNSLKVKFLMANPAVAYNSVPRPNFTLLTMASMEEVSKQKVENRRHKAKAHGRLEMLTPADQRKYFTVIFGKDTTKLTEDTVYERLSDYIEGSIAQADTFVALLEDKSVDEKFKYNKLYSAGIITKDAQGFKFNNILLGFTFEDVYKFFSNRKNQELKDILEKEYTKMFETA
jgi:hypothetical protein